MPLKDPEQRKAYASKRCRIYRAKKHAEKYGPDAGDMRGKHGNHARGPAASRWNGGKMITSHGYVAVRVSMDHPHAWGKGYCYEHHIVMMGHIGRPLAHGEVVHHRNGDKQDNRIENLELLTMSEHQREHALRRGRDSLGRFPAAATVPTKETEGQ